MSKTTVKSIYETTFAPSDKTDAILVVDGKKLHVNKALLSYHCDFFKTLFNSEFAEKKMSEIPIKDVKFEDMATLLSLIQEKPIMPNEENSARILDLADRFLMPAAKKYLELSIVHTTMSPLEKLKLADKHDLDFLRDHAIQWFKENDFLYYNKKRFIGFSNKTQAKLFNHYLSL